MSVQEPHTDQSAHPSVVIATIGTSVVVSHGTSVGTSHGTSVGPSHGTSVAAPLIYIIILPYKSLIQKHHYIL